MARYYSICEMTGSYKLGMSYNRVRSAAPRGYLFHQSDERLTARHIWKPLFKLYREYPVDAKRVVAVRVDENTIAASFSTSSFPIPTKIVTNVRDATKEEYLTLTSLEGWVFKDISDPKLLPEKINFSDVYDQCMMLERMTGSCPCPKQQEGTCFQETVLKRLPFMKNECDYGIEHINHKSKRFSNIDGFEFCPGQYTIGADFTEAVRPWDNYQFSLVPQRTQEFKDRGAEQSRRKKHREEHCSVCSFGTLDYSTKKYKDCGRIANCKDSVSDRDLNALLYGWLATTPFKIERPDWPLRAIKYLVRESGCELKAFVSTARRIDARMGGFYYDQYTRSLKYRVVATNKPMARSIRYPSYEHMREKVDYLPKIEDLPEVEVTDAELLAHLVFATWTGIAASGLHQPHDVHYIESYTGGSTIHGCTSVSSFACTSLSGGSSLEEFYKALHPRDEYRAKYHLSVVQNYGT